MPFALHLGPSLYKLEFDYERSHVLKHSLAKCLRTFLPIGRLKSDSPITNIIQFVNVGKVVESTYGHHSIVSTEHLFCMYYGICYRGRSILISHIYIFSWSRRKLQTYIHIHHIDDLINNYFVSDKN